MKTFLNIIYSALLILIVVVLPFLLPATTSTALAADVYKYVPLEPIPGLATDKSGTCDKKQPFATRKNDPTCQADIVNYIPNLIKLAIALAGGLAVVMIAIGGFEYITATAIGAKSDGKTKIQNAIYGLLLALGAYILLNSISPATIQLKFNLPPIPQGSGTGATPTVIPNQPCPAGQTRQPNGNCAATPPPATISDLVGRPWPSSWPGGAPSPTDASVRNKIMTFPVPTSVNRPTNCVTVGEASCTSLDGLSSSALQGILTLAYACQQDLNCGKGGGVIVITGGTEFWLHGKLSPKTDPTINPNDPHRPGGGGVDISKNSRLLNNVIMGVNDANRIPDTTGCAPGPHYRFKNTIYVDEAGGDPHWHVCY